MDARFGVVLSAIRDLQLLKGDDSNDEPTPLDQSVSWLEVRAR
jgi:hypothetical protein